MVVVAAGLVAHHPVARVDAVEGAAAGVKVGAKAVVWVEVQADGLGVHAVELVGALAGEVACTRPRCRRHRLRARSHLAAKVEVPKVASSGSATVMVASWGSVTAEGAVAPGGWGVATRVAKGQVEVLLEVLVVEARRVDLAALLAAPAGCLEVAGALASHHHRLRRRRCLPQTVSVTPPCCPHQKLCAAFARS